MAGYVGVAPGTTTVQLPDGRVVQFTDWIDDKHYGSAEWNTGDVTALEVFSQGKSQQITGGTRPSTRVDTNIPRQGDAGLPKDWEFLVYSIGIEITRVCRSSTGADPLFSDFSDLPSLATTYQFGRRVFCQYEYNGKVYAEGPIFEFPSGTGLYMFTTNSQRELVTNGPPSARDRISMVLPLHERENLGYKMRMSPEIALVIAQPASDAGAVLPFLDVKVKKYGLIRRNVT